MSNAIDVRAFTTLTNQGSRFSVAEAGWNEYSKVVLNVHRCVTLRKSLEGLQNFGDFLRCPQDSQNVSAENLVDGLPLVASIQKFLSDSWVR